MKTTPALRIAAAIGFLAVALGAFGAHGLKATLEATGRAANWETAAHYHLVHAVILVVLALVPMKRSCRARYSAGETSVRTKMYPKNAPLAWRQSVV